MASFAGEFLQNCFSGAPLAASSLLLLAVAYWLLAIFSGMDWFDFGADADLGADLGPDAATVVDADPGWGSGLGLGLVVLRFFHLGRVPLMIWGSVFVVVFWAVSLLLDRLMDSPETRQQWSVALQHLVRNLAVSLLATKFVTLPLRDRFDSGEPNPAEDLLGRECTILTSEVTEEFGQAEVLAQAAPLRLHVRLRPSARGGEELDREDLGAKPLAGSAARPLTRGDAAVIVGYDRANNVFFVRPAEAEV